MANLCKVVVNVWDADKDTRIHICRVNGSLAKRMRKRYGAPLIDCIKNWALNDFGINDPAPLPNSVIGYRKALKSAIIKSYTSKGIPIEALQTQSTIGEWVNMKMREALEE